jgi:hypothetical protein
MNVDSIPEHILNSAFHILNISILAIGWLILSLFPFGWLIQWKLTIYIVKVARQAPVRIRDAVGKYAVNNLQHEGG